MPRSWDEYRDVLPLLGKRFQAIAMNTIGYGDSSKPPLGRDSIEHWAEVAMSLMDALGIRKLLVVGHTRRTPPSPSSSCRPNISPGTA